MTLGENSVHGFAFSEMELDGTPLIGVERVLSALGWFLILFLFFVFHCVVQTQCASTLMERREEEGVCDHIISAARRRDASAALRLVDRITNIIVSRQGAWAPAADDAAVEHWRLEAWEDDSRRRKRFSRNAFGSSHPEATLKAALEHGASEATVLQVRRFSFDFLFLPINFGPKKSCSGRSSLQSSSDDHICVDLVETNRSSHYIDYFIISIIIYYIDCYIISITAFYRLLYYIDCYSISIIIVYRLLYYIGYYIISIIILYRL